MKCPKCGHERQPTDNALDGECPSCGSIYTKHSPPKVVFAIPIDAAVQVRPWVRFWARYIDIYLLSFTISFLLSLTTSFLLTLMSLHLTAQHQTQVFLSIVLIGSFFWVFVEALLLSTFGTTPGKWLFKTKLALASGEPISYSQAISRSLKVWWRGLGTGFPIVAAITQTIAYGKLKRNGVTSWDREGDFVVTHEHIGVSRILVAIVFFIVFSVIVSKANHKAIAHLVEISNPQVSTTSSSVTAQGVPAATPEPVVISNKSALNLDEVSPAEPKYTATEWRNKANELGKKKDWLGMTNHALRWIQAQPEDDNAWYNLGYAYGRSNQHPKEIEAYQQAIRINPEDAYVWYSLGLAYSVSNQPPAKAIEAYQQAVRINPEHADVWCSLGNAYSKSNQPAKAIEAYQQAIRINPENAEAWDFIGNAYGASNQPAKAIEAYQQAIRINPEHAGAWYALGGTYLLSNQLAKAIEAYQQAIRIKPEDAGAWYLLGDAYRQSNQPAEAIEAYQQSIRINPEDAVVWYYLGLAYKLSGQTNQVMEVYKRLKTLDPAKADEFFNKFVLP